jgi:hypothetical protein
VLGKRSEFSKVTVVRIPRDQGMLGNKEADRLAKEGAIEVPPDQFTAVPFCVQAFGTSIMPGGLPVLAADSPKC